MEEWPFQTPMQEYFSLTAFARRPATIFEDMKAIEPRPTKRPIIAKAHIESSRTAD